MIPPGRKACLRRILCFSGLIFLILLLSILNLTIGSVHLSPDEVFSILFRREGDSTVYNIIWRIRFPRILAALLLGGALSVSGFLLQTFFHNPIAGPYVLGISSGARLALAFTMISLLSRGRTISAAGQMLAAFAGSMTCMAFVLLISGKVHSMSLLVICGVMISYICSAATEFAVTFADDSNIVNLHSWSQGGFSSVTWSDVPPVAVIVLSVVMFVFFLSKPISAYQLGEGYARNVGVNIAVFRVLLILCSSILSACVTAFAGPVSFVGVAVPHVVKHALRTTRPLLMTPACFLGGAVFCLFCDLLARTLFAPVELSISTVTALFGAPVVILIMIRRQKEKI